MNEKAITLGKLAYACSVYDAMTGFGDSFGTFQRSVNYAPDLKDPNHRDALLKWLNAWGCRNLALACHPQVSERVGAWYRRVQGLLPSSAERLTDIDDAALEHFAEIFDDLSTLLAREGTRNGRNYPISFGPTAASKTLFALRPCVFVAWDDAIRRELVQDASGASYVEFLRRVRDDLKRIAEQCSRLGIDFDQLPEKLGRLRCTGPQLVGEYYWITITREVKLPGPALLCDWLAWS